MRQAARAFLSLPGVVGLSSAIDLGMQGGGVHSNVKQPHGRRMASQLLAKVFGLPVRATRSCNIKRVPEY